MDPNATLLSILTLAQDVLNTSSDADEINAATPRDLAEAVTSLHDWISRGGFLPEEWAPKDAHDAISAACTALNDSEVPLQREYQIFYSSNDGYWKARYTDDDAEGGAQEWYGIP